MPALTHAPITRPLESQVGGHAGVLTTHDGSLIVKPTRLSEVKFYQSLASNPTFAPLRPFTPKFLGALKLEAVVDQGKLSKKEIVLLVLENIAHSFLKPNILDIKLGRVLYDTDAPPEKRARKEKAARECTAYETGLRLTGFQVYDNCTGLPVNVPKAYGRSIKAAELLDGMVKFFPLGTPSCKKDSSSSSGLPKSSLLPILRSLRRDVAEIRDVLANIQMRMIGGSLLIVYEADWQRAAEGVKGLTRKDCGGERAGGEGEEGAAKGCGPPCVVKLIDFAHTELTPGEDLDPGVLLGIDTTIKLLDGRIEQLSTP